MKRITFNDANDIIVSVELEGIEYMLRMTWNMHGQYWTLSLMDKDKNLLISNVKVVMNYPLLMNKHCFNVPRGEFIAQSPYNRTNHIGRKSFNDDKVYLMYYTKEEWLNAIEGD